MKSEMEQQLTTTTLAITSAIVNVVSTTYGKLMVCFSFCLTQFADIKDLVHVTFAFVLVDMILGVWVTIKCKGWSHILSSRLRDSVIKLFFYLLIMMLSFLIEKQIFEESTIGAKVVFAILSSVELISIIANMLIISPKLPFLKFIAILLKSEIAKKLGIEREEVDKIMKENKQHRKQRAEDTEKEIDELEKKQNNEK